MPLCGSIVASGKNSLWLRVQTRPHRTNKNHKQPDGSIKTGPKGFHSTCEEGDLHTGITIGKVPEYVHDPYENYEDWLKKER